MIDMKGKEQSQMMPNSGPAQHSNEKLNVFEGPNAELR